MVKYFTVCKVFSPGCSEDTLKEIGVELMTLYSDNTKHKQ